MDEAALRAIGLANGTLRRIKILGTGELAKKLVVVANAISASARTTAPFSRMKPPPCW